MALQEDFNQIIDFNFADGMICDWKNEREYRLLGYISHMSENIADGYLQ